MNVYLVDHDHYLRVGISTWSLIPEINVGETTPSGESTKKVTPVTLIRQFIPEYR